MSKQTVILVVEDDEGHARLIKKAFRDQEELFHLELVTSLKEARDFLSRMSPNIIVTDLRLPDGNGTDLLPPAGKEIPYPVVAMTSFGDQQVAVEAMKTGALDYVVKSAETLKAIPRVVNRVLREWGHIVKRRQAEDELRRYNERLEEAVKSRTKDLEQSYQKLLQEILQHKRTQSELDKYRNQLEDLVAERTRQLEEANRQLGEANRKLEKLANFDGLTGVANRRNFMEIIEEEWKRGRRSNLYLGLIMLDVDFFKPYNDSYGHQAGDGCLIRIASLLQQALVRSGDFLARYGGEEFIIVLPGTDTGGALAVAEKLRVKIEEAKLPHGDSPISDYVTISMGIASAVPSASQTYDSLIAAADKALYKAKSNGRNRCES